jgi:hypothetical protein
MTYQWRFLSGTGEMRHPTPDTKFEDESECGYAAVQASIGAVAEGYEVYRVEVYHTSCGEAPLDCTCA